MMELRQASEINDDSDKMCIPIEVRATKIVSWQAVEMNLNLYV